MSNDVVSKRCELVTNGTQDTDGVSWPGGDGTFMASGTLPSGGITLQFSQDGVWVPAVNWNQDAATLTAAGCMNFTLPRGRIRASAGGSSTLQVLAVGN
jgi:hypothetical protein